MTTLFEHKKIVLIRPILFSLTVFMLSFSVIAEDKTTTNALSAETANEQQKIRQWESDYTALTTKEQLGERISIANKLASAYHQAGFINKAAELIKSSLKDLNNLTDSRLIIQTLLLGSDFYLSLGQLDDALGYAKNAVDNLSADSASVLKANVYYQYANTLSAVVDFKKADEFYQKSIKLTSNPELLVKNKVNRLFVLFQIGNIDRKQLITYYEQLYREINTLSQAETKLDALISAAALAYQQSQSSEQYQPLFKTAFLYFNQAQKIADEISHPDYLSISSAYLARLYLSHQRYQEAMTLANQAVFYALQTDIPHYLYQWYALKADIAMAQKDNENAIDYLQQSVAVLDKIRNQLDKGVRSPIESFDSSVKRIYYSLADLLLQKAETIADSNKNQQLLFKARDVIESLKAAELENYFQDECVANLQTRKQSIEKITSGAMVLYPISLADRLVLLVSSEQGIRQFSVAVSAEKLEETAQLFRLNLQTRPHNRFLHQAEQLYQWLIKPLHQQMDEWQIDTIVVIADDSLRSIPFSAFYNGKEFLVEHYAIAIAPGFTLIEPKSLQIENAKVLMAGLSEAVQDFSALPSVNQELKTINSILGGQILKNKAYTLEKFKDIVQNNDFSIVHMATHAQFTGQHNHDYLLTYDDKLTIDKLKNLIGFGQFRDNPIELLTMSACQTALGDNKSALGLAGVAVKAGARSALATLWFVDDEATSLAITDFYRQLSINKTLTKAKALQMVQKKLIEKDRYWHPSYWAPFLLIGNWL